MKLMPMDVQRQSFPTRFRGLDPEEVRQYLTLVAEELASLQQARDLLEQEVQTLRALVDEHHQRETILKNTLLTAQRLSEEIKEASHKQAELVVKEAELKADQLLGLAQTRASALEHDILDLHNQRQCLRADVRGLIGHLTRVLDLEEEAEQDQNLRFLKRTESSG